MKTTISVGRCLKREAMLVRVKVYINENFATCNSLCNLQKLKTAFNEKYPNVNTSFSNLCASRTKWCVQAGSKKTQFVCVCSADQNVVVLVDAMDWGMQIPDDQINLVLT